MTDTYQSAHDRAADFARVELAHGVPPDIVAIALLGQALAVWAAGSGRYEEARELLRFCAGLIHGN